MRYLEHLSKLAYLPTNNILRRIIQKRIIWIIVCYTIVCAKSYTEAISYAVRNVLYSIAKRSLPYAEMVFIDA